VAYVRRPAVLSPVNGSGWWQRRLRLPHVRHRVPFLFNPSPAKGSNPKARVVSEFYYIVVTTKVFVNRQSRLLKGNVLPVVAKQLYGNVEGIDPCDRFQRQGDSRRGDDDVYGVVLQKWLTKRWGIRLCERDYCHCAQCKAALTALGLDPGFGIRIYEPNRQGYDLKWISLFSWL
jgi:hypothetical protein